LGKDQIGCPEGSLDGDVCQSCFGQACWEKPERFAAVAETLAQKFPAEVAVVSVAAPDEENVVRAGIPRSEDGFWQFTPLVHDLWGKIPHNFRRPAHPPRMEPTTESWSDSGQ
jgi:hypothetical protein